MSVIGFFGLLFALSVLTGCPGDVVPPNPSNGGSGVSPTPTVSATPGVSPTPTVSPTPGTSPTPTVTPSPSPSPTPRTDFEVGVCTHLEKGPEIPLMKNMGAKWIRIDMNWNIMQPQPNQWDFDIFDQVVNMAVNNGLQVYASIGYSPDWASSNGKYNGVPKNVEDWKTFVRTAVTRYKNKIKVWGIWNEPNLGSFWAGSADQYSEVLLKPAYQVIKSIDSSLTVAAPDLALLYDSATIKPLDFFNTLKRLGAGAYFDIITHHVYGEIQEHLLGYYFGGVLYKDGIKQILEKSGFWNTRPLWITETGWDSAKLGETKQSDEMIAGLKFISTQSWVQKAFVYEAIDDPNINEKWGILRADVTQKPSYDALKKAIQNGFKP